ncbi:hypothetical protein [Xanthomonas arboricola]|uniref:hypothetical protein n=1 Tax=Xanthomonas arboricola TaxID=56448 RepID=UPI001EDF8AF8|nr:hypothetical protein [Xanthomonas arboricola]
MRFLFVVLAALAALPCSAQQSAVWERQHLGDYTSEPGEALPDFLKRAGVALHDFTRQSGNEACGAIARNGRRFAFRLYTDCVPHGCSIRTSDVPDGFAYTGETLHSHPWQKY